MKAEELKTKTEDELKKLLLDTRKEQLNLRFQRKGGTLDNTSLIRKNRRTIARLKTFLSKSGANDDVIKTAKKAPAKKATTKKTTSKAKSDKKSDDKAA